MAPSPPSFDQHDYERFRDLILERSGLHFPEKRRLDLERGLHQALARTTCCDLDEYFRLLQDNLTGGSEWEELIAQLTVGETYFFRDRGQFEALRQHVLPELIARKRSQHRQLRIWSAGCATGEEPYSVAILLQELLPDLAEWNVTILATDINRDALGRAQAGRYGDWSFREEGWESLRERHFARHGKEWELAAAIRDRVAFAYLNLVEDAYPSLANNTVAFDLILCRNVTIYFVPERVRSVVDRLYESLAEGGWLLVGHSEPSPVTYARFEVHMFPNAVLYQKTGRPARFDLSWLAAVEKPVPAARLRAVPAPPAIQRQPVAASQAPALALPARPPRGQPIAPVATAAPADSCAEAVVLLEQGQVEEALERLHRVLQSNPRCAQAYLLVGRMRANAGHWEEAQRWCEQALELDSLLTEGHFLLGLIHGQRGHLDQALTAMRRVVYLDRNAILGHFCLANFHYEAGNATRAFKSLENAARLLAALPEDEPLPWSDGITAGRLLRAVRQLQADGRAR